MVVASGRARCRSWRIRSTSSRTRTRTESPPGARSAPRATAVGADVHCPRPAWVGLYYSLQSQRREVPQTPGCIKYLPRSLGFRRLGSSARISPAPLGREGFRAYGPGLRTALRDRGSRRHRPAASEHWLCRNPSSSEGRQCSLHPNWGQVPRVGRWVQRESKGASSARLAEKRNSETNAETLRGKGLSHCRARPQTDS